MGGQRAGVGDGDEGRGRQGRDRQTVGGLGDMRRWDEEGGPLCSFFARRLCATNVASDNGVLPVGPIGDSTTVLRSDADPTGRKDRPDINKIKPPPATGPSPISGGATFFCFSQRVRENGTCVCASRLYNAYFLGFSIHFLKIHSCRRQEVAVV